MVKRNVLFVNPDTGDFGPFMKALLPRQRAFVDAMITGGDTNYTRAALTAGYSDSETSSIRVTAHRLAHDAKVLAAIHEESVRRVKANLPLAIRVIMEIAEDPLAAGNVKLKAAEMLLNRGGMHVVTKIESTKTVVHQLSSDQRTRRIAELMAKAPKALPAPANSAISDAEFEEVVEPSSEGLEDMLG